MRNLVEILVELAGLDLELVTDGSLLRKVDVAHQVGSPDRLRTLTGWKPEVSVETGLGRLLEWWEDRT
jgi:GDP-4-dehydro-6-deoxy-D-mannose reductase